MQAFRAFAPPAPLSAAAGCSRRSASAAAHAPACPCAACGRRALFALPARRGRAASLSVCALASPAPAAPLLELGGVLNMKPGFAAPPSAAGAAAWQAIIEVGGAQQFVSEGRFYSSHSLLGVEAGQSVAFERVLATKTAGEDLVLGRPYVAGARVIATVLEHFRDKKITVFKMKAKKHYRRTKGHRQAMTRFLVTKVEYGSA